MSKRHVGEFLKSGLANSGRAAGMGIVEDNYDDDSSPDTSRRGRPVPIAAREVQEEYPVKTYYIEVHDE